MMRSWIPVLSVAILTVALAPSASADKWVELKSSTLQEGDTLTVESEDPMEVAYGPGVNKDSGCHDGTGGLLKPQASCARICTDVPAGETVKQFRIYFREENSQDWGNPVTQTYQEGKWIRFEGVEYYEKERRICFKVKNWSRDRKRHIKAELDLGPES